MQEHDRYPRTLVGTYLKDYFRRDLYVVSPEHIGNILAKIERPGPVGSAPLRCECLPSHVEPSVNCSARS